MAGALIVATLAQAAPVAAPPPSVEGRPAPGQVSPLQALVDRAAPGERIVVPAGTYTGDLLIDRPVTLVGSGRPLLVGSGAGSVVRVRAADVTIEGVDIDGINGGDLGRDSAGIHVAAAHATIRDVHIRGTLFGIYLLASDDAVVEHNTIAGIPGLDPGEKGSGIHVWNSRRFHLIANDIVSVRDGFYIQSSSFGLVRGNTARDLRYGLHYMFSDDNVFEDNTFENGAAGAALMYSERLTFRRNRFLRNRGFASVGLLLKECDDIVAEDNLIADNARGVFLEGSYRNQFRRNVIAMSDMALVIYDSSGGNTFEGNAFIGNLTPLSLSGHRTDTRFTGNYWSDNAAPDFDGDGISDTPYRLSSVFDHIRGNLIAADLFSHGVAALALGAAEQAFPVLDPVQVTDARPLARPPLLEAVPTADAPAALARGGRAGAWGVLLLGAGVLAAGGRSWSAEGGR
ncbi:MAG: nitrous oxide reductase family maturation protein NosD [Acidobacteriota bacterium]